MFKLERFFSFYQFDGKLEITIKLSNFKDLNEFEMLLDINFWAAFADNLNVSVLKKILTDTNIKFKNDETTKNSLYLLITTLLSFNNIDFHKNKDKEAFFDEDVVTDLYSSISTLENIHDLVYRNNEFMRDPEITLEEDFIRLKKQLLDIRNYKVVLISDNEESKSKRIFFYKYFNDLFTVRKENYCFKEGAGPENIELINLDSKTSALVFVFTADSNLKNNDEIYIFGSFLIKLIEFIIKRYNFSDIILKLNTYYNRVYFQIYGQNVVLKRFLKFFDFLLPYLFSDNESYKHTLNDFLNKKFPEDIYKEQIKSELLKNGNIMRLVMKLDTKIIYVGPKDDVVEKTILNIQKRCHLRKLFEKVKICSNDSLIGEVETKHTLKTVSFYLVLMEPYYWQDILLNKMFETLIERYFLIFFQNNCEFIYYKGLKIKNMYNSNVIEIFIQSTVKIEELYKIIRNLHEFINNNINDFSNDDFSLLKETVKNQLQVRDFRNPSHIINFLKSFCFLINFKNAKHNIDRFLNLYNDMYLFKRTLKLFITYNFIFPQEYLLFINEHY
ncbi:hypothetical protein NGRA_2796 [Nosema granulosis]|uniref:Uncharacterized protein n=1 Tax=Nosema granulosis TaxID=83296 RepID=A0A9P6GX21_9MICR|nr:hypothetical protein NGRA_2796 [Nosema granulosis]